MREFHSYGPVNCKYNFCVERKELVEKCTNQLMLMLWLLVRDVTYDYDSQTLVFPGTIISFPGTIISCL